MVPFLLNDYTPVDFCKMCGLKFVIPCHRCRDIAFALSTHLSFLQTTGQHIYDNLYDEWSKLHILMVL